MGDFLNEITSYLLAQSWQIAVLVVAVAATSFALRNKSAHVRYLLWLIVLAKCLLPPFLTVHLAVLPQKALGPQLVRATSRPMPELIGKPSQETLSEAPSLSPGESALSSDSEPASPRPSSSMVVARSEKLTVRQCIAIAWILGAAGFLLTAGVKAIRNSLWLYRERKPLPAQSQSWIKSLCSSLGLKSFPKVWLVDRIGQPFVWGLLRGSIYLPADFIQSQKDNRRRDVLAHELSHIRRFDAAVNLLQLVAQAMFWFHPFVWWANKRIRSEREKCCDETAIARLGANAEDYGAAIVETLTAEHESTRPVPSLAVAGPLKNIEERIKTIMKPGKKFCKRPSLIAAAIVLLAAAITVPTAVVLTAHAERKSASGEKTGMFASQGDVLFFDGFEGKLKRDWEIVHPDLSHWSLSKKPGTLTITTQEGGFDRARADYENLFLIDCPAAPGEDFQLTTCLSSFKPLAKWNQAGLVCYNDDDNYLKFVYEWSLGYSGYEAQRLFTAAIETGGRAAFVFFPADQQLDKVWLHLTKQGNKYTFSTSLDGKVFVPAKTPLVDWQDSFDGGLTWGDGTVKRVGLFANNGSATGVAEVDASFDFFEVKVLPAGPAEKETTGPAESGTVAQSGDITELLHQAAAKGDVTQIKSLISRGADLNKKGKRGDSALHRAARGGHKEAVQLLIAAGADFNVKDKEGKTPLYAAMESRTAARKDVVDLLVEAGAEIPAIHLAACTGDLDAVRESLEEGVSVSAEDRHGGTPLHAAAASGDTNVAEFLIGKGGDVGAKNEFGITPLHYAAMLGYQEVARLLLDRGADINAVDRDNATPLLTATWRNQKDIARLLISRGADVNIRDSTGYTPLNYAVWTDDKETARLLISKGADVHTKDAGEYTPLHYAVWQRNKDIVELLVQEGADVNAEDSYGCTAVYYAAHQGSKDLVKVLAAKGAAIYTIHLAAGIGDLAKVKGLIEEGTDVDAKNKRGSTALHFATQAGQKDVAEFLIANGADLSAKDKDGRTPLHLAAHYGRKELAELLIAKKADIGARAKEWWDATPLLLAAQWGHADVVKLLIDNGAEIDARSGEKDFTPLQIACVRGHGEVVEILLEKGAKIEAKNIYGQTPLHLAVSYGHPEVVKLLLAKGADALATTAYGMTPLHYAARDGQKDMVEPLLAHGANIDGVGSDRAPIHDAMMADQKEMVRFLIDKGAEVSPIHVGAYLGQLDEIRGYLAEGVSVNEKDQAGFRPLHCAVCGGQRELVEFLIAKGAEVDAKNIRGSTALHLATGRGNREIVELLLAKGSKVNLQDKVGRTALYLAAYDGWKDGVELLIAAGTDITLKHVFNYSPLLVACRNGHKDVAELLIEKGADMNAKTNTGDSAIALAKKQGHTAIVELLRKHGAKE